MINIKVVEENLNEVSIDTNGYMILFFKEDKIKSIGNIDIRALTPILTKVIMEKMTK